MIQMQSNLRVADNSGARHVSTSRCWVVNAAAKSVGIIVVSIKEAIPTGRVKKGDVRRAVVVRVAKDIKRRDGSVIRFDTSAAVLVNNNGEPIGTYLRPGSARASRQEPHEDRLAGSGGAVVMAAKVKKGDRVIVTAGRNKGAKGEVLKVIPAETVSLSRA